MKPDFSKIILGTVQLGLDYGINNSSGKPSISNAFDILKLAYQSGIKFLDTAEAYGDSQKIIGQYHFENPGKSFRVLSKFKLSSELSLNDQFIKTISELNVESLYAYSYHQFSDALLETGKKELISLKADGKIVKLGVSIYSNTEFSQALELEHIDIIQIPFNLLDNWFQRGELIKAAKLKKKEIHIRSVFLQGLFFKPIHDLPLRLVPLTLQLQKLKDIAENKDISLAALALGYTLSFPEIDKVLIGIEMKSQLEEHLKADMKNLDQNLVKEISAISLEDSSLIDPRKWN